MNARADQQPDSPEAPVAITPAHYRDVLGHYPTGVVVVTAATPDGPVGMVIGSFTSVSLDPPQVAFLPMKNSSTWQIIREASSFCINVLSSEQEALCRAMTRPADVRFDGVSWRAAPSGAPILDGVVAWMDCRPANIYDGADHDIVLGLVTDMQVESRTLPLLFFQGGYGRFVPGSFVVQPGKSFINLVRMAEVLRDDVDALAGDIGAECSVIGRDGLDTVFLATSNHSASSGRSRLGARVPLVPPLGTLFVGTPGAITDDEWVARLGRADDEAKQQAHDQLKRVRERGWSLLLDGKFTLAELDTAVQGYSSEGRTPAQERAFLDVTRGMACFHEPADVNLDKRYDVLHIAAPVTLSDGTVPLVIRLGELPQDATGAEVGTWAHRLVALAGAAAARVEAVADAS